MNTIQKMMFTTLVVFGLGFYISSGFLVVSILKDSVNIVLLTYWFTFLVFTFFNLFTCACALREVK